MSSKYDSPTRPHATKRLASSTSTDVSLNNSSKTNLFEIDKTDLYKALLKVVLLEYSNEARFRTPIIDSTSTLPKQRSSMLLDSSLPNYVFKQLNEKIELAMFDQMMEKNYRRTLLRLYNLKASDFKNIDFLITKFASFANAELKLTGIVNDDEVKDNTFKQTISFIDLLIDLVKTKKDHDVSIITKLKERKMNFQSSKQQESNGHFTYPQRSYRITDMNTNYLNILKKLFNVDDVQLQIDVFKYKDVSLAKPLYKDITTLEKKRSLQTSNFQSENAYAEWAKRQEVISQQCKQRYKVPAEVQLIQVPQIAEEYFIIPHNLKNEYLKFVLMLFESEKEFDDLSKPFLNKFSLNFLTIVSRVWHIDWPTRAVALYLAGLNSNAISEDKVINVPASEKLFQFCKSIVEEQMDWDDKYLWSIEDQDLYIDSLSETYSMTFLGIKNQISCLFDKPKFKPFLQFLGDYIESDILFRSIESSDSPKKWELRLEKAVLKAANKRYYTYFDELPRDNSSTILHILNICDKLVDDIKSLQKRYKTPLLGFLNIAKVVASLTTRDFASDCKKIVIFVQDVYKQRDESIPYSDGLEVYKSLAEIRDIFYQTSPPGSKFQFHLENFFFSYLENWVEESNEKIMNIVQEALKRDNYQPINEEMHSQAILDIFSIIKTYLTTLKKQNWNDEYQLARMYTILLKSISNGALLYSDQISNKLIAELEVEPEPDSKKNWLEEVKNVVTNRSEPKIVYNFQPETCIALNNLSAMMNQLTKLEEWIDPELISKTISNHDRSAQSNYLSHVFTIRVIRGENIRASKDSAFGRINPYVTLNDRKKLIGRTRTIYQSSDPEFDEEFEIKVNPNTTLNLSLLTWDERFGHHQICGRTFLELDPKKFSNDGMPLLVTLDLDLQGKLILEVSLESETLDALFVIGRAYRSLNRAQERSIKLIVEKFSGFIHQCFSKLNLKKVCSKGSPSREEFEESIENLCDYLNMNLSVLKEFLTNENFMKIMIETWKVTVTSADDLLLPKLSKAKISDSSWQLPTKFANVLGFESQLSGVEIETVLGWLALLADFFHNEGNGPAMEDLKVEQYQSLLLIPALHDQEDDFLIDEVDKLSPAFVQMLSQKNLNMKRSNMSISRSKTFHESATSKGRKKVEMELKHARHNSIVSQNFKEDIILRILISKSRKDVVCRRLDQRNRLAHTIFTEQQAREIAKKRN